MQLQDTTGMDRAQWYETRRNELLKLLERTTGLEIPEKEATELAAIRKKCLENQFEIVLVAEFQGGKSTTFNALCDGRDLSPRGLGGGGIKTSAAIISAQNISDGETKNGMDEWAEITFKSKYEIQLGMYNILHGIIEDDQNFKDSVIKTGVKEEQFEDVCGSPEKFSRILDLDNPLHRKAVHNTLTAWWDNWKQDKRNLSDEELDQLHIATLIERFYGSKEYKKLITKNIEKLYDFQSLIAFPTDWISRWSNGQNVTFKLAEVAFIFIKQVLLHIKSKNLSRIGCRITDCPGLFANDFDTKVAKEAIGRSDAVWYLIGGDKQIGKQALEILKWIKGEYDSKTIASVNLKGDHTQQLEVVFPAIHDQLKSSGFSFSTKLAPYNARLAFLAAQGERLALHQKISETDLHAMRIDSKTDDTATAPGKMWSKMIRRIGAITGLPSLEDIDVASEKSVAAVRKESYIDNIMSFLNQYIITNKAREILISSGSQKAANALQRFEAQLKTAEDSALNSQKVWDEKVAKARKELEDFKGKATEFINESMLCHDKTLFKEQLSRDLIKQVFDENFIRKIARIIAKSIKQEYRKFFLFKSSVDNAITRDILPKFNREFKDAVTKVLTSWKNKTCASDSWISYTERVKSLKAKIKTSWGDNNIRTEEYTRDIPLEMPKDLEISTVKIALQEITPSWSKAYAYGFAGIFKTFRHFKFGEAKQQLEKQANDIFPRIEEQLKSSDFQDSIRPQFEKEFEQIQNNVLEDIRYTLCNLSTIFDRNVEFAKHNFSESETKRKEIAEKNHKIRVEQIEPLRREIREFEAQVSKEIDA